ncbi:unnamed protein product [Aphis gossypii]|uniref:Secreted protein n=1 Tax=Aphis gossypii TaxID=80765 RepID=A0A9P0NGS3_APHGO|nr:unnamed protein product [Aphis gossypii]
MRGVFKIVCVFGLCAYALASESTTGKSTIAKTKAREAFSTPAMDTVPAVLVTSCPVTTTTTNHKSYPRLSSRKSPSHTQSRSRNTYRTQ